MKKGEEKPMAHIAASGSRSAARAARAWLKDAPVAAAVLLLAGLVWIVTLERVHFEHADAISDIERDYTNLTLALEEHSVRTLGSVHQVLADIALQYRD